MAKDQTNRSYFRRYGFAKDPFDGVYDPVRYFITPELQHRLELLKHLLEFSQQILLVKGPQRAGKSAFGQHLIGTLEENWLVSRVSGESIEGPDSLIRSIIGPGEEQQGNDGETISALNRYLSYCENRAQIPLVVIDNAEALSEATLAFVFQLINFKQQETYIRVLVLGGEEIAEKLNQIASEQSESDPIHSVNLPSLSIEQTQDFLNHCLDGADKRAELIPDREVQRIHKVSAGIIGDIMFLASQGLINPALDQVPANKSAAAEKDTRKPVTFVTILIPAVLLALVMSWLFLGNDKKDAGNEEKTVALAIPVPEKKKKVIKLPEPIPEEKQDIPGSWMQENEEQLARLEQQKETGAEAVVQQPVLPKTVDEVTPAVDESIAVKPVIAAEVKDEVKPKPVAPAQAKPERHGLREEAWLSAQDKQHYALQLLRAIEKNTVLTFIADSGLDKTQLSLYETSKADKSWYVLLYGLYPDIDSARQAVASLPASVKSASPWPKQISAIQREINSQ